MKLPDWLTDWIFGKPKDIGVIEWGRDILGWFPAQGHDTIVMTVTGVDGSGNRFINLITLKNWELAGHIYLGMAK